MAKKPKSKRRKTGKRRVLYLTIQDLKDLGIIMKNKQLIDPKTNKPVTMDSFRTSSDHMKGSTTIIQPANNNDVAKEKEAYDKRNARIANGEDSNIKTRFDDLNNNPLLLKYNEEF